MAVQAMNPAGWPKKPTDTNAQTIPLSSVEQGRYSPRLVTSKMFTSFM